MYDFMAEFVEKNLTDADLNDIVSGVYGRFPENIEEAAVNAYYEVPIHERITMHQQMLENLEAEVARAKAKVEALQGECPFDPKSPIYVEYMVWRDQQVSSWRDKVEDLEQEIHEEEQWRGGHEDGASDVGGPMYDHMDEC
jgi:predicted RNase H-like nuclease (RuvC/YqgF family)